MNCKTCDDIIDDILSLLYLGPAEATTLLFGASALKWKINLYPFTVAVDIGVSHVAHIRTFARRYVRPLSPPISTLNVTAEVCIRALYMSICYLSVLLAHFGGLYARYQWLLCVFGGV